MIQDASREVFRALSLSIDPLAALSMDGIRREEREKRRTRTREMYIAEQETMCVPAVPKSPPLDTDKLAALVLSPDEHYVEKTASSSHHTIDLIHEAIEELHSMPTLIEIGILRYIALGKLQTRFRYYYNGILVPFRPAMDRAQFDVRVYGMR